MNLYLIEYCFNKNIRLVSNQAKVLSSFFDGLIKVKAAAVYATLKTSWRLFHENTSYFQTFFTWCSQICCQGFTQMLPSLIPPKPVICQIACLTSSLEGANIFFKVNIGKRKVIATSLATNTLWARVKSLLRWMRHPKIYYLHPILHQSPQTAPYLLTYVGSKSSITSVKSCYTCFPFSPWSFLNLFTIFQAFQSPFFNSGL